MDLSIIRVVLDRLAPTELERVEAGLYCERYKGELDYLSHIFELEGPEGVILEVNYNQTVYKCNEPELDACVDVASTLESLLPEVFAGKFKY